MEEPDAPELPENPAELRRWSRGFDLAPLIEALRERTRSHRIRFRGNPSAATHATLIHDIEVNDHEITVVVNVGMFSAVSALPTYFERLLVDPRGGEGIRHLLASLDEKLLELELSTFNPEPWRPFALAPAPAPEGPEPLRRRFLNASKPASPATLHWLFRSAFPELGVSAERASLPSVLVVEQTRLGRSELGIAVLGGHTRARASGVRVRLTASAFGPWPALTAQETLKRLVESVLPALKQTRLRLQVLFVSDAKVSGATLGGPQRLGSSALGDGESGASLTLFDDVVA